MTAKKTFPPKLTITQTFKYSANRKKTLKLQNGQFSDDVGYLA